MKLYFMCVYCVWVSVCVCIPCVCLCVCVPCVGVCMCVCMCVCVPCVGVCVCVCVSDCQYVYVCIGYVCVVSVMCMHVVCTCTCILDSLKLYLAVRDNLLSYQKQNMWLYCDDTNIQYIIHDNIFLIIIMEYVQYHMYLLITETDLF